MEFPERMTIDSFTITIVPRYCETDQAGVVHHTAYPVWFEMGRTELLRANGLAYSDLKKAGIYFVVAELTAKYRSPALYDEKLELSDEAIKDASDLGDQVARLLALVQENIARTLDDVSPEFMAEIDEIENDIDDKERKMRERYVGRLREGSVSVDSGLVFIDMLTSFEKIGDHAYNVAEMLAGKR